MRTIVVGGKGRTVVGRSSDGTYMYTLKVLEALQCTDWRAGRHCNVSKAVQRRCWAVLSSRQ